MSSRGSSTPSRHQTVDTPGKDVSSRRASREHMSDIQRQAPDNSKRVPSVPAGLEVPDPADLRIPTGLARNGELFAAPISLLSSAYGAATTFSRLDKCAQVGDFFVPLDIIWERLAFQTKMKRKQRILGALISRRPGSHNPYVLMKQYRREEERFLAMHTLLLTQLEREQGGDGTELVHRFKLSSKYGEFAKQLAARPLCSPLNFAPQSIERDIDQWLDGRTVETPPPADSSASRRLTESDQEAA